MEGWRIISPKKNGKPQKEIEQLNVQQGHVVSVIGLFNRGKTFILSNLWYL